MRTPPNAAQIWFDGKFIRVAAEGVVSTFEAKGPIADFIVQRDRPKAPTSFIVKHVSRKKTIGAMSQAQLDTGAAFLRKLGYIV